MDYSQMAQDWFHLWAVVDLTTHSIKSGEFLDQPDD
jgi:hypothetical protein